MAYKKKYATEEERRLAKAEAGRKGAARRIELGHSRGGRPKGSVSNDPRASIPTKTMTLKEDDYKVFVKLAYAQNVTISQFMHLLAESLKSKNPAIFEGENTVNI